MRSFTRILTACMIILCMGVAGYSGYKILSKMLEYRRGDNTYQALEKHIDTEGGEEVVTVRVHARSTEGEPGTGAAAAESTAVPDGTDAAGTQNRGDGSAAGEPSSGTASDSTGEVPADQTGGSPDTYEGGHGAAAAPEDGTMSGQGGTMDAWAEKGGEQGKTLQIRVPQVDFDALLKENPDTVGWIFCPDTHINYPVVQGRTNDDYLHTMFNGEYNSAGTLFLDKGNERDFTDANSIIYGHHMRNGSMFHDLIKYKDKEFFETHPYMIFLTPEKSYLVEVLSAFVSSVYDNCWPLGFRSEEEREKWIRDIRYQSDFPSVIMPLPEDRILTLSTCTYEFSEARYVVYGILTEIEQQQSRAAENESPENREAEMQPAE